MSEPQPFQIDIRQQVLERIRQRVRDYRWFPAPETGGDWQFGMSAPVMKDIQAYWLNGYDWRKVEAELNAWPHFKAEVDGQELHFLHIVGEAGGKRPLLLTHGWPGSFYEFFEVIGPLAFPPQHMR